MSEQTTPEETPDPRDRFKQDTIVFIRARIDNRVLERHRLQYTEEGLEPFESKYELPDFYVTTCDRYGRVTTRSETFCLNHDFILTAEEIRRAARGNG